MILSAWQRKIGPMAVTGSVLVLIGALFIIIEALFTGYMLLSIIGTLPAQGEIIACTDSDSACQPIVRFQTSSGQQITFRSFWSSSLLAPGEAVLVRYHPDDPQNAQVDFWVVDKLLLPIFGGVGLLLMLPGLVLIGSAKGHPSVHMIDRYFTALKNQDYATAFQYLNPIMKTREGQQITLDWFMQRTQAYDMASGKVSSATITRFSLNSNRVQLTMKIRRGEKSYKVRLYSVGQGDTWKITGFDLF